ncbi:MAG: endonuclease/exonuclease/phosphatase family protein [Mariniblastus sp.]
MPDRSESKNVSDNAEDHSKKENVSASVANADLGSQSSGEMATGAGAIPRGFNSKYIASLAKRGCQGLALLPLPLFMFSLLGKYFFFAELLGNFRGYLMITLVIAVAIFVLSRQWLFATLTVPALCWSLVGVVTVYAPLGQPVPGPERLKVMSFNVLGSNPNHHMVAAQIRSANPDVVSILEYTGNWHQPLDCLNEKYPHQIRIPRWHGFGVAMFSKYPFTEKQEFPITKKKTDNPMIVGKIKFGSGQNQREIRLAAIHVLSPTNRSRMDLRNQQFIEIAEILSKEDTPTIVMGDFNCVPWSPFLSNLLTTTDYRDSRQGFGYHGTWHTQMAPVHIPIDHAFVSRHIHIHDRYVGGYAGSDHLPIVFEVSVGESVAASVGQQ